MTYQVLESNHVPSTGIKWGTKYYNKMTYQVHDTNGIPSIQLKWGYTKYTSKMRVYQVKE